MQTPQRTPKIYEDLIEIRFSDLDRYNHVNSKHYVDLVSTARLNFMAKEINMTIERITERGIGFFMTKSVVNYKRPILGLQKVRATSHVGEVLAGKILVIPFVLSSEDKSTIYSDGTLEFAVIDIATNKTTVAPDWVQDLFYA